MKEPKSLCDTCKVKTACEARDNESVSWAEAELEGANIFKIKAKDDDLIDLQKFKYTQLSDFFCLEQIGIYRSNHTSVKQLAEIFYLLAFEYFDYENFKVVLELNNYGNEFLAHLPHVFDGKNNYGSSIFFRYKHRVDSTV